MSCKIVCRIHNHLRDTHKIKDEKVYKKLLNKAVDHKELLTESESESSSSEDEDSDRRLIRSLLKVGGKKYLRTVRNELLDTDDSSDEDWLETKVLQGITVFLFRFVLRLIYTLWSSEIGIEILQASKYLYVLESTYGQTYQVIAHYYKVFSFEILF